MAWLTILAEKSFAYYYEILHWPSQHSVHSCTLTVTLHLPCFVMKRNLQSNTDFIAMNDKHTCKVGELGFPVAAVERGKQVVVAHNQSFEVCDHDFTKIFVTPSVTTDMNIPDDHLIMSFLNQGFQGTSLMRQTCDAPHQEILKSAKSMKDIGSLE